MKKLLSLFLLITTLHLAAQNKLPSLKIANNIKPDIEKVTRDYYDHFFNIKGEKIAETESTIEYQSKVIPVGAVESTITQIKSLHNVYSWQATMLTSDSYKKAVDKYKQIYRQLDGTGFVMHDNKTWKFKGNYDAPDDGRSFASSILEPETDEKCIQMLKIEVALNYVMPDWSVKVLIYEKQSDENIRPTGKTDQ